MTLNETAGPDERRRVFEEATRLIERRDWEGIDRLAAEGSEPAPAPVGLLRRFRRRRAVSVAA